MGWPSHFTVVLNSFIRLAEFEKAIVDLKETLSISEKAGDKLGLCMTYNKLGVAFMGLEQLADAKTNFYKALELSNSLSHRVYSVQGLFSTFIY